MSIRSLERRQKFRKLQEEAEERKKQAEMDACMNKEQQVPEDQQSAKATMEHAKEKERVHMAHKYIEILSGSLSSLSSDDLSEISSDDSSDSSPRQKLTKPVTSSNKSDIFTAKLKSDNEETPLKQPHQDASTSKQEILETINFYI